MDSLSGLRTLLKSLPPELIRDAVAELPDEAVQALRYDWRLWARPEQLEPGTEGAHGPVGADGKPLDTFSKWLYMAGRGAGKTRSGAEWVLEQARTHPEEHGALVAATMGDVRKTMLSEGKENITGESGILAVSPGDFRPIYEPSKYRLTWPNGAIATTYSADEPDRLRGPQHGWAWADELVAWKQPETWDMLMFGLRLGHRPRVCVTTTPKPKPIIRQLLADPMTAVTRGRTRDNIGNLARSFVDEITRKYGGTRLGRQELDGEVLEDVEGALWTWAMIEAARQPPSFLEGVTFDRLVVAIDPQASEGTDDETNPRRPETGIIVVGCATCYCKAREREVHGFVLEDLSGSFSPATWGRRAIDAYRTRRADKIIAEKNNGGEMVEHTIRVIDPNVSFASVWASRGKRTRAEPVSTLYEQGKVHHIGVFPSLEDQLCTWAAMANEKSPDRLDALVWGLSELLVDPEPETVAEQWSKASW